MQKSSMKLIEEKNESSHSLILKPSPNQNVLNCEEVHFQIYFHSFLGIKGMRGLKLILDSYNSFTLFVMDSYRVFIARITISFFRTQILLCLKGYGCNEEEGCKQEVIQLVPDSSQSLAMEFSLYCSRRYLLSLCQTLFFVVSNISTLVFSFLADLYGRKKIILICYIIGVVPLLFCSFIKQWVLFLIVFTIAGIGLNPYSTVCFVLLAESAGEKYRQGMSVGLLITWGLGQLILVPIAYRFRRWEDLLLWWIAFPLCLQIIAYLWIYESPKFLVIKKQWSKARQLFESIAKVNNRQLPYGFKMKEEQEDIEKIEQEKLLSDDPHPVQQSQRIYTYYDLVRYKSQLLPTIILSLAFFAIYLSYYGMIFALDTIGNNIYLSAVYLNLGEISAYLFSGNYIHFINVLLGVVINYVPRKISCPVSFLVLGISCLFFLIFHGNTSMIIMAVISRFSIAICNCLIYVYTAEIYPATVRSIGLGATNFIGKFGCAVAPGLIQFCEMTLNLHPMSAFGIVALLASIATLFLKETKGLKLEDEIEEIVKENKKAQAKLSHLKLEETQQLNDDSDTDISDVNKYLSTSPIILNESNQNIKL